MFEKFTEKDLCRSLFPPKSCSLQFKRKSDTDVFCEFCKHFKDSIFAEELLVSASVDKSEIYAWVTFSC